ncbi:ferredoxin reductase family protein [Pseudomonas panipatensis]|uniref:Predicted ferric reductase n=1 Tax=Pseudomonas panipatensis TaxID=428992 RepID=A0A1G8FSX4_9PSED|nr:ferric reductase-like transmembrane domain-containing protein [Pseudomonas panipatensis]SDH85215.1 Predicted ferric reductase [Pseudomonas panipatensis]SMP52379.1 Predicted ferric reductase [Pseudomonas panipatensis]
MKNIKIALWALLIGLSLLWALADSVLPQPLSYFALRTLQVQYTGILAIAAMSVALLLAVRPRRIEPLLGGLDKMYRLHKWLGISALAFASAHWVWAKGTKWAVGWGWLTRPPRAGGAAAQLGPLEQWLHDQRGLAESLGEWAFYAAVVLIVLALFKRFPYRWFAKTHILLAALYLLLAYHSVVLLKFSYWSAPVGLFTALLLVGGSLAALKALFKRIGAERKVRGSIQTLIPYPELDVLETRIALEPGWPGHKAGQFAFVTSSAREGAHPYTIASAWRPQQPEITFITKALGDHTSQLPQRLRLGMPVTVEGPYGCFTFEDQKKRQIWIGAGIGITPFVARLKQLALEPDRQHDIDLYHPSGEYSAQAIDNLYADAMAAGVRLHLLLAGQNGRLSGERLRQELPDWQDASVWFCGPAAFGRALRHDLLAHGLNARDFHQELFQMR